jgi:hypothetical protein
MGREKVIDQDPMRREKAIAAPTERRATPIEVRANETSTRCT